MLSYKQHTFGVFIFLVIIKYENYFVVFLDFLEPVISASLLEY